MWIKLFVHCIKIVKNVDKFLTFTKIGDFCMKSGKIKNKSF